MDQFEFLGNLILLIVGGNDTTRNSMSAVAYGLDLFPDERAKLEADPSLIPNAVQEIIRWQTPLAHMRRTATQDTELAGQQIKAGDKLALWYLSANRDESVFGDDADDDQSSTAPMRGGTSRSATASTAASARGWPSCRSACCSRRWPSGGCG